MKIDRMGVDGMGSRRSRITLTIDLSNSIFNCFNVPNRLKGYNVGWF